MTKNEQKTLEDPAARVIRKFGREHECVGCNHFTSHLHETFYSAFEKGIIGKYECKCGYKQGKIITGKFAEWYRINIMKEDIEATKKKEKEKIAAIEAERIEALQLPEVKIG